MQGLTEFYFQAIYSLQQMSSDASLCPSYLFCFVNVHVHVNTHASTTDAMQ